MAKSFPLSVPITAIDRFTAPLGRMGGAVGAFGKKLKTFGRDLTTFVTLPTLGLAAASIKTGTSMRRSLNEVQASTGATEEQMAALRRTADELGGQTHTLGQVAHAMALVGDETENALAVQAMTPGTLRLATIANIELEDSVDKLDATLDAFNLTADQSDRVVDALAATARGTKLQGLLEGLEAAGPLLRTTGTSVEGSIALLEELGEAGFEATRGAAAVATAVKKLQKPGSLAKATLRKLKVEPGEIRTSTGALRPLVDVVDVLREHGADATDVLRIFGTEAGPAMAALLERGTTAVRKNEEALGRVRGRAQEVVGVLQSGGVDSTVKFADAWERVTTALAESGLLDAFAEFVRHLGALARGFQKLDPETKKFVVTVGAVAAVAGPALVVLGSLVQTVTALAGAYKLAATGAGALAARGGLLGLLGRGGGFLLKRGVPIVGAALGVASIASDLFGLVQTIRGKVEPAGGPRPDLPAELTGASIGAERARALEQAPPGPARAEVGGRVRIELPNLPAGARVRTEQEGGVALDVYAGHNLAGAL